jgi:hypothetical protein
MAKEEKNTEVEATEEEIVESPVAGQTVTRNVATDPEFAKEKQAERDAIVQPDIDDASKGHANRTYEDLNS